MTDHLPGMGPAPLKSWQGGPRARRSDPETSHAAARSIRPESLPAAQAKIHGVLEAEGPGTDEDILERLTRLRYPISVSGARTRRAELVKKGLVKDSGLRRVLVSHRKAIVWEVV